MMRQWLLAALVALVLGSEAPAQTINGAGSTFVAPLMEKWGTVYGKAKEVKVNYVSIGSGAGVKGLIDQTLDFACTDAPLTDKQLAAAREKGGTIISIPLALGGIVPAYNLKGIKQPLRLSGPVLADIFLGRVTKWNDPAIKELNAGVELPDQAIQVVRRADSSGSTFIFTDFLSKVSPEWKDKIGSGTLVNWPVGIGTKGNEGVAAQLAETPGAIGYVDLLYALRSKLAFAAVKNPEGNYVVGSLKAVTAAAQGAIPTIPDDLRFSLTNAPGEDAYPISGCTWAVIYAKQDGARGQRVLDFLRWATHEGQEYNTDLYYARLPKGLAQKVEVRLKGEKAGK